MPSFTTGSGDKLIGQPYFLTDWNSLLPPYSLSSCVSGCIDNSKHGSQNQLLEHGILLPLFQHLLNSVLLNGNKRQYDSFTDRNRTFTQGIILQKGCHARHP